MACWQKLQKERAGDGWACPMFPYGPPEPHAVRLLAARRSVCMLFRCFAGQGILPVETFCLATPGPLEFQSSPSSCHNTSLWLLWSRQTPECCSVATCFLLRASCK